MPIVVVISPHATETVGVARNARFFGYVRERAIRVVAIQCVADLDATIVQVPAIDEIDILETVAVVVGNARARTGFPPDRGDAVVGFEMDEIDAGGFWYLGEWHASRLLGRRRRGGHQPCQQQR